MKQSFQQFMSQLQETNQTLNFFCDFSKIAKNVDEIKLSLCMLNSLLGCKDLKKGVETIWNRDQKAFEVLDILIAVRANNTKKVINERGETILLKDYFKTLDSVVEYLKQTGLADILQKGMIKDLYDYVFGIETGLDTNARKNRSGKVMEQLIAKIFKNNGIPFRQEVYSREWDSITKALGSDEKRFDFVVQTNKKTYLMEVNFYSGGGSKPNEVARSYSDLAPKINSVDGFEFVWITDGKGWNEAKNKLEEAYNIIPSVYNLSSLETLINRIKTE